jgi:hypothetical protein
MAVTDQRGLGDVPEDIASHLHLYLVCQRPRISVVAEEFSVDDASCRVVFDAQHGDEKRRFEVVAANHLGRSDITMQSVWPHTDFSIVANDSGEKLVGGRASLFASTLGYHDDNLDLKVMYVGQAYGSEGERSAVTRLSRHETLQAIYAEAVQRAPDKEVALVLLGLDDPYGLIMFAPVEGDVEQITERFRELTTPIGEQQQINFTDAALIRYFQPQYNRVFRDTFPSPAHKTYAECYDLDLNLVAFEMETSEAMRTRLYSDTVSRLWTHTAEFFLHSKEERRHMFDFAPD